MKTAEELAEKAKGKSCPHCGKPWPVYPAGGFWPLGKYRIEVAHGYQDYCCDATRRDCEGAE